MKTEAKKTKQLHPALEKIMAEGKAVESYKEGTYKAPKAESKRSRRTKKVKVEAPVVETPEVANVDLAEGSNAENLEDAQKEQNTNTSESDAE